MKGLELSRKYFETYGLALFKKEFPELFPYMAFGLVGEGSELFGLDDEISQDHDFGPGFCIWLPDEFRSRIPEIDKLYDSLPKEFLGYTRQNTIGAGKRLGGMTIGDFYLKFTGNKQFPMTDQDWLKIPESFLATCTNGEVFLDNFGEFSRIRNYLLGFYPEDVFKKKLAAYLANMAQSGQYNLLRSYKRKDAFSFNFARIEFIKAGFGAFYLLSKSYMPYYKLMARKLEKESYYPRELLEDLKYVLEGQDIVILEEKIENICNYLGDILRFRGLVSSRDSFLISLAEELQKTIKNESIRKMHIMKGNDYA